MQRRKITALSLCVFYLFSVIGIALSLHFCGNKLETVQFTKTAGCKMCKAAEKKAAEHNCCKNTAVDVKVTDSHQSAVKTALPKDFSLSLLFSPVVSRLLNLLMPQLFSFAEHNPPPLSGNISLHILNCVFRN